MECPPTANLKPVVSTSEGRAGGAFDRRTQGCDQGVGCSLPEGVEEGEGRDLGRAVRTHGLAPRSRPSSAAGGGRSSNRSKVANNGSRPHGFDRRSTVAPAGSRRLVHHGMPLAQSCQAHPRPRSRRRRRCRRFARRHASRSWGAHDTSPQHHRRVIRWLFGSQRQRPGHQFDPTLTALHRRSTAIADTTSPIPAGLLGTTFWGRSVPCHPPAH